MLGPVVRGVAQRSRPKSMTTTRFLATKKQQRATVRSAAAPSDTDSATSGSTSSSTSSSIILGAEDPREKLRKHHRPKVQDRSSNASGGGMEFQLLDPTGLQVLKREAEQKKYAVAPPEEADPSGVTNADPTDMIDFHTLYDPLVHLPDKPHFGNPALHYEPATPLGDELLQWIGVRGPITVADFMHRALADPQHGYYTTASQSTPMSSSSSSSSSPKVDWDEDSDGEDDEEDAQGNGTRGIFGTKGDFVTAPEISQVFGECLTVWYMTQYQEALHSPPHMQWMEIGPGNGTLLCDMMRTCWETDLGVALRAGNGVHLVEVSPALQERQKQALLQAFGADQLEFHQYKPPSILPPLPPANKQTTPPKDPSTPNMTANNSIDTAEQSLPQSPLPSPPILEERDGTKLKVTWHDLAATVPTEWNEAPIPTFVVCQELIDALPVHVFQKTEEGWRERLVDVDVDPSKTTTTPSGANNTTTHDHPDSSSYPTALSPEEDPFLKGGQKKPRFRLVLPPDTTPALRTLLKVDAKTGLSLTSSSSSGKEDALDSAPVGSVVEVCPEGMMLAQDIWQRIVQCGGAALIIDYGHDGTGNTDTLRAFHRHKQVHLLSRPGRVDVTADVNFGALKQAIQSAAHLYSSKPSSQQKDTEIMEEPIEQSRPKKIDIEAFGPVTQGHFLARMGAMERVTHLIQKDDTTDQQAEDLFNALERLVLPEQMGERYKVMAICKKRSDDIFSAPPGF